MLANLFNAPQRSQLNNGFNGYKMEIEKYAIKAMEALIRYGKMPMSNTKGVADTAWGVAKRMKELEQQVKSVDLADVVCWVDMTEETPNLGDLILVRFPPEQRTRPVIIEFDELFEWIDGTQYIRL